MDYKELKLKWSNRAIMVFEQITERPFAINTTTEMYIFLYATILANNSDIVLTFDEFINDLDNDEELLPYLLEWFNTTLLMRSEVDKKKEIRTVNQ